MGKQFEDIESCWDCIYCSIIDGECIHPNQAIVITAEMVDRSLGLITAKDCAGFEFTPD